MVAVFWHMMYFNSEHNEFPFVITDLMKILEIIFYQYLKRIFVNILEIKQEDMHIKFKISESLDM